ncbi:MAG TPA: histidine kinase dimerization/phosphoacceptor domain -containing protein, partial [Bacteroidia bacterium]|nr:histidine kinase dimerization/phosphoacceptor domain -containing protein [Bacteroidia bacterium]
QWSEKKLLPLNIGNKGHSHPEVVYRFIHGSDGNIWAAAQNGVYVLNTMGTIIDYYGNTKEAGHELPFSAIYDIHEDSIGVFWFCTGGQGLFRWNKNKNEFRQFTFADGLPANVIYRVEKDNSGNLWISTDYGLTCLNPHNNSIINYDMSDGLSQNEFNRESSFKAANGRLFFGSINGVNAFYPRDFIEDTTYLNVPLQIISFNKFSSSKNKLLDLTTELITGRTISLNPDDKFFNLQFMLLDYKNGKKQYAYKIDGIDKDWNNINENSIRISGLPYGEFTLHIKGRTAAGAWSRSELVIPIIVYTPYYRKAWFIILSFLSIIFLVYGIIRYRTQRLEIEKVRLENIVSDRTSELKLSVDKQQGLLKEKDMLLKEIHHRVKNNLQVISNLLEMQNVGIDDERAKSVIKEGQNRVRSIALIHQKLYQNEDIAAIDLADFTNELFSQVMGLFRKPGLTITKEINMGKVLLDIDTAVPLGLILNELFTNTFKYAFTGNTGHITITFEDLSGGNYSIIYKDNGKGLPPDFDMNKAHSVGLWLVVSLSKQLGGEAKYEYENGSKFSIYFKDTPARKDID